MKFILSVLKQHLRFEFSRNAFVVSILFAAILVISESIFQINEKIFDAYTYNYRIYIWEFIRNVLVYYGCVEVLSAFGLIKIAHKKQFFLVSIAGIFIFSFYSVFYAYVFPISRAPFPCRLWLHFVAENIAGVVTFLIPVFLLWYFVQKRDIGNFYGLHFNDVKFTRYIDVIGLIMICMFFAMNLPGISEYYPLLDNTYYRSCANYLGVSKFVTAAGFELSYLFDFIWIELFFRGFLVIGLVKFLGKEAILPMAVLYVTIHFGKPMPEIISSFFGGYLLGVIAYQTNNIRAGILLHITLAFSAEIFGILLN